MWGSQAWVSPNPEQVSLSAGFLTWKTGWYYLLCRVVVGIYWGNGWKTEYRTPRELVYQTHARCCTQHFTYFMKAALTITLFTELRPRKVRWFAQVTQLASGRDQGAISSPDSRAIVFTIRHCASWMMGSGNSSSYHHLFDHISQLGKDCVK